MNKLLFTMLLSTVSLSANEYESPFLLPETNQPEPRTLGLDQVDNTDTYAIPYDTSEVEDEMQIDSLYNQQRRIQERKKSAPSK